MTTANERLMKILSGMKADRPACICPGGMMNMVTKSLQDVCGVYLPEAHTDARMMADLAMAVVDEKGPRSIMYDGHTAFRTSCDRICDRYC